MKSFPKHGARAGTLDTAGAEVRALVSTPTPVQEFGYDVTLSHAREAIDLADAQRQGIPIFYRHDDNTFPIGRARDPVVGNDGMRMRLDLTEATEEGRTARQLIDEGTITDVSIRYRVQDFEGGRKGEPVTVTRWRPDEVSLVGVPADIATGIGRSLSGDSMDKDTGATKPSTVGDILDTINKADPDAPNAGAARAHAMTRCDALSDQFPHAAAGLRAVRDHIVADETLTAERADAMYLEAISLTTGDAPGLRAPAAPKLGVRGAPFDTMGESEGKRMFEGMQDALIARAFPAMDTDLAGNEFSGMRVADMARTMLVRAGVSVAGMDAYQILGVAFSRAIDPGTAQYTTASFPALMEGIANKALFDGFAEAPRTWDMWCSVGSVADFKPFTRPALSHVQSLPVVAEGAEYTNVQYGDKKEGATMVKYGGKSSFTREAAINDDLSALTVIPRAIGESAQRVIDSLPYSILTSNPAMQEDSKTLFHADHNNTGTAALDDTSITAAGTAMGRQTDWNPAGGIPLGVSLRYIIVPLELRRTARKLASDEYLVNGQGAAGTPNDLRNTFVPVVTHMLSDENDWYAAAGMGRTIEIVFLQGRRTPTLEREMGWSVDSMHHKGRIEAVALPLDFRGLYRNVVANS